MNQFHTLRLILGDQLNASHSWYSECDDGVLYLIAELRQETDYAPHHVQKVCAFFAAMKGFALALEKAGHQVLHLTLDETQRFPSLEVLLTALIEKHGITQFEYQLPDEYRLWEQLRLFCASLGIEINTTTSEHFLVPDDALSQHFTKSKHHLMESFYRKMRKQFDVMMEGDKPEGGKWNYDKENRAKLSTSELECIPEPLVFTNDVSDILGRLERHGVKTIGTAAPQLLWPVTRRQSMELLDYFCKYLLPKFGSFQDAMTINSPHRWSLYHSRLSFALNSKMLHPMQVIQAAIEAYRQPDSGIGINQIEGFVRQILGWREFVRGLYWANMPDYSTMNALGGARTLPEFFWTGETKMQCLKQAIQQSLDYGYAHHIQRLMVTGNFALLAGIVPEDVDAWYLGIYVDAIEWVELPNVRGMALFADGGLFATKPYSASGNYINKMSDYCTSCHYKVKEKVGEGACPLNSLYWHFMERHRARIAVNPRAGMVYRGWDVKSEKERNDILTQAECYLTNIEML
ncbi:cryptochrome/photolyase family protein [Grimontia sp. NTOU-MAR1]|uniref:cryptochrome/photolyase family protein n=1 Tax=Grimontia sp. NTOU-MAR1 TaxID=3111011 RepID=UPI002DB9BA43|nr:cryptochrome/photolyase family protein [Grimontia sp. NTOU-MAR1]WRV99010.1 cryptochrome/photolyase family protein [Grimontia sp. NTOU-MAR1]